MMVREVTMKLKVGTLLDVQLVKKLKGEALDEGLKLNALMERALWHYLSGSHSHPSHGRGVAEKTRGIIPMSKNTVQKLLKLEPSLYDT